MFTGLIEDVGRVVKLERRGSSASLSVATALPADGFRLGDSVAVNGVCLTVVVMKGDSLSFDVSPETLDTSSLGGLTPGGKVNLERAMRLSDRLGGHIVTGHIDCVATVAGRREESGNIIFDFRLPEENARFLVPKGSVAIDGISLTVNRVSSGGFSVNIIPHTAAMTTLHARRQGDTVNIETDIIGKYVDRLLTREGVEPSRGISLDLLARNGFL
ncbi:MAG TPA: riboflavin synthase [Geobacteraceae bacterium]|nr:riboflavin synthase [Geobacteraceae bacterium]